jgi:hypothetical protein
VTGGGEIECNWTTLFLGDGDLNLQVEGASKLRQYKYGHESCGILGR